MSEDLCVGEPRKGKLFIIKGNKPKQGHRLCAFVGRENVGCQLHGELMAYRYIFAVAPDFQSKEYIVVDVESEKETVEQQERRWQKLYERAVPYTPVRTARILDENARLREALGSIMCIARHEKSSMRHGNVEIAFNRIYDEAKQALSDGKEG